MIDKDDIKIIITLLILAIIAVGVITIGEKIERENCYKLDYEIETYIDNDGVVYKVLRDSNGDNVYLEDN